MVAGWNVPAPDLHVVGLQNDAALPGPETLQGQDQPLERFGGIEGRVGGGRHKTLRVLSEMMGGGP